ncbi:MAG: hypothetical protein MZV64_34370 [Ignavibacteriales bacterium]|nr:hypothetical protein [Ignavibacteriales bacterium]
MQVGRVPLGGLRRGQPHAHGILVEAGPAIPERRPGSSHPPCYPAPSSASPGSAACAHWVFAEDRMMVVGTVPVDDAEEAQALARDLCGDPPRLASRCSAVWKLIRDGIASWRC